MTKKEMVLTILNALYGFEIDPTKPRFRKEFNNRMKAKKDDLEYHYGLALKLISER